VIAAAVVLGPGVRRLPGVLADLPVTTRDELAADPERYARLVVCGSTAAVAAVAALAPRAAISFGGAPELTGLFAIDPSPEAARARLEGGTEHPADLGLLQQETGSRPFLAAVGAGGGAALGLRFPWAHRRGPVSIRGSRNLEVDLARAVIVANTQLLGPWLVAPRAAVNDSRLDIQVLSGSVIDLIRLRPALRLGLHERFPGMRRMSVAECEVIIPKSWRVACDGAPAGRGPFRVALQPGAATLLV